MLYSVVIPILLLFVPWLLVRYVFATKQTKNLAYRTYAPYLVAASALWVLSFLLPNVPISSETDSFTMHSLGGMVAAVLFVYTVKSYDIRFEAMWQVWVGLYLFTSGLGVLNELAEFFLTKTNVEPIVGGDEWWDLLANTLGAFVAFGALWLFSHDKIRLRTLR